MAMTNREILAYECSQKGFNYDGENLFTYQQWKERGFQVKRGEKCFIKTSLWTNVTKKEDDGTKNNKCYMMLASLFTDKQVEKIK